MAPDQLTALVLFALAGSFTPGPNNTIAALTGANFGWRAAVPHMLGVPLGFGSMLLAAAGGVASVILAYPWAVTLIRWLGTAYLLWLAYWLVRATPAAAPASGPFALPLSFSQSALFQYLNPKAWMLAAATAGAFFTGERPVLRGTLAAIVFALAAFASIAVWALVGEALRGWLAHGKRLRVFNSVMAATLAATALWMNLV